MNKRAKAAGPTREQFIDAALELLEMHIGLRELNLRQIARKVGCAHTNAYNYFSSYEDLLWFALKEALVRMVGFSEQAMPDRDGANFRTFIGSHVDFALVHPGLYRFIWMDPLAGEPPAEVALYLGVPGTMFREALAVSAGVNSDDPGLLKPAAVIHGYLHGELSKFVANRTAAPDAGLLKEEIVENTMALYALLLEQEEGKR